MPDHLVRLRHTAHHTYHIMTQSYGPVQAPIARLQWIVGARAESSANLHCYHRRAPCIACSVCMYGGAGRSRHTTASQQLTQLAAGGFGRVCFSISRPSPALSSAPRSAPDILESVGPLAPRRRRSTGPTSKANKQVPMFPNCKNQCYSLRS